MNKCLSESDLISIVTGEGSAVQRHHLESCLVCARRYRRLNGEMRTIVSVLKQPVSRPSRSRGPAPVWRWSLAAAAVLAAFMFGRLTIMVKAQPTAGQLAQAQIEASYLDAADDNITPATYAANMTELLAPVDSGSDLSGGNGSEF